MATNLLAKSILKTPPMPHPQPTLSDEQKVKAEANRKNLSIALHHANQIQYRKDIEARIFGNLETLLEFPSATPFSPTDAARFVSLIRTFQPSDYDNLIEERRIDGKCGYCICSNAPRAKTMGASAAWKLKVKAMGDFCSDRCARKALYVKTQLSEVPAWERRRGEDPRVVLDVEDRVEEAMVSGGAGRPVIASAGDELAMERGETATSFRPRQVMMDEVVENRNITSRSTDVKTEGGTSHNAIEGYEPGSKGGSARHTDHSETSLPDRTVSASAETTRHEADEEEAAWRELFDNTDQP